MAINMSAVSKLLSGLGNKIKAHPTATRAVAYGAPAAALTAGVGGYLGDKKDELSSRARLWLQENRQAAESPRAGDALATLKAKAKELVEKGKAGLETVQQDPRVAKIKGQVSDFGDELGGLNSEMDKIRAQLAETIRPPEPTLAEKFDIIMRTKPEGFPGPGLGYTALAGAPILGAAALGAHYGSKKNKKEAAEIGGIEKAAEISGEAQLQHQSYMPIIRKRRELSSGEEAEAERESSKLIPRIFTSKADSPFVDMANPVGRAGLYGAAGAGIGGVLGGAIGGRGSEGVSALLGALLLGIPGGAAGYLSRNAENESIKEQMRNLPRGATRRTLESDPVYQKDMDRRNELLAALAQSTGRVPRRF